MGQTPAWGWGVCFVFKEKQASICSFAHSTSLKPSLYRTHTLCLWVFYISEAFTAQDTHLVSVGQSLIPGLALSYFLPLGDTTDSFLSPVTCKVPAKQTEGFPIQLLTAQLLTGALDAQSSTAQLLNPTAALLLLAIHGYPAAPSLKTEHSSSEQNSQQKSQHLMSTWNCFPFNSGPNQHLREEKPAGLWLLQHVSPPLEEAELTRLSPAQSQPRLSASLRTDAWHCSSVCSSCASWQQPTSSLSLGDRRERLAGHSRTGIFTNTP